MGKWESDECFFCSNIEVVFNTFGEFFVWLKVFYSVGFHRFVVCVIIHMIIESAVFFASHCIRLNISMNKKIARGKMKLEAFEFLRFEYNLCSVIL